MSERTARTAELVLNNLLKAKRETKDLAHILRSTQSELHQLSSIVTGLGRGDVTTLLSLLAGLGPYGVLAAIAVGTGAVAYGIFEQAMKPRPEEIYQWRYPS